VNQFGKFAEKIGILVQGGTVNVGQIRLDSEMSRQELRNRKALLNNVRTAWVEGVLEKSLHEQIPIVLGLENRPNAVASPWNLDLINPDQSCQPLSAGTPVIDVFDKLGEGGTLLILGEPGSGKTITLLQLARDLIARAEEEIDRRIPVVLNLSSWAAEKQTIAKWIVEELNSKYQVNRKIGQQWVEKQELLLLLDGLDEIRDLEKRNACVTALNAFQQEQAAEIVVCCRIKDYEELGNQLTLRSALVVQPLTTNQIQTYLNQLQSDVTALKIMLTQDATLQELAQSPLLLSIMVLTYQGIEVTDISVGAIASDRKKYLFDNYINRIFQGSRLQSYRPNIRTKEKQYYSKQNTTLWLVWMAKQMVRYSQTVFLIETMQFNQPDELSFEQAYDIYHRIVIESEKRELNWIKKIVEKIFGISDYYISWIMFIRRWKRIIKGYISVVFFVIISLFIYKVVIYLFDPIGWLFWIAIFTIANIAGTARAIIFDEKIEPVEKIKLHTNWKIIELREFLKDEKVRMMLNFKSYIIVTIVWNLFLLGAQFIRGEFKFAIIYFVWSFILTPNVILVEYISKCLECRLMPVQVDMTLSPNQGIKKSAINFMIFGIPAVILMSIIYLYFQKTEGISEVISSNPVLAYLIGLAISIGLVFDYGGKACLQHFVLRLFLCITGSIPWNYAKFLDWASDKLFLQKVGGGYIFIHRSLMEHFAEMENG
jgi:Cdc6-like AAA superfamily ATPase